MELFNSRRFIVVLLVVLLYIGVTGCAKTADRDANATATASQSEKISAGASQGSAGVDVISNAEAVGKMLGCIFAPQNCDRNGNGVE